VEVLRIEQRAGVGDDLVAGERVGRAQVRANAKSN
jgi:hypothetical protein